MSAHSLKRIFYFLIFELWSAYLWRTSKSIAQNVNEFVAPSMSCSYFYAHLMRLNSATACYMSGIRTSKPTYRWHIRPQPEHKLSDNFWYFIAGIFYVCVHSFHPFVLLLQWLSNTARSRLIFNWFLFRCCWCWCCYAFVCIVFPPTVCPWYVLCTSISRYVQRSYHCDVRTVINIKFLGETHTHEEVKIGKENNVSIAWWFYAAFIF